jgi:hypothetical protein
MRCRRFLWLSAFALVANLAAADFACPVTAKPDPVFVPPAPYEPNTDPGYFWYGTNELWTDLPDDGIWHGLPYAKDEGFGNKLFLWQQGYDGLREPQPDIIVVLRRLDGKAPLAHMRGGTNALFPGANAMLIGVTFPTLGCWEVTSYYAGHTLTFVLSIRP